MNQQFLEAISIFVFMYPAGMAIYWVTASLCYYLFMEGKLGQPTFQQMPKERVPMVSIMVPCYNEGDNLDEAIPYLLPIDYMVQSLELNRTYGAVTGNPRVRNRSTILGRLQVSEFSSIIGLIKRAQSLMGTIFTVSGVCCLFRKDVMEEIGGWSTNMITEDIDVSWKIQTAGYNIMYEPRALCWVLMPERLYGLYKQRLRWAQGGAETILKYFPQVWRWRNRRLWPMYAEYFVTATWAILLVALVALALYRKITLGIGIQNMELFETNISLMFFSFFLQCLLSLYIDSRYEKGLIQYGISCIWYPYVYWLLNTVTLLVGIPKAIFRNKSKLAVWTSPDRGV